MNEKDISRDADLAVALMNLLSLEEHLVFSYEKTGNKKYLEVLDGVREIRKKAMNELVRESEGELWCISKHLLAASMRLIEVGTKHLSEGDEEKATEHFHDAFYLYSLFFGLNKKEIHLESVEKTTTKEKLIEFVKRVVDCCKE